MVLEYWKELILSCVVVTAAVIFLMVLFGSRLYPRHWFESSITRFGIATGVAAIGLMLLHITDPDLKTDAAETYALSADNMRLALDDVEEAEKGRINAMPGFLGGRFQMAGIKWIGSNPKNQLKGLPRASSIIILNDPDTKFPICIW